MFFLTERICTFAYFMILLGSVLLDDNADTFASLFVSSIFMITSYINLFSTIICSCFSGDIYIDFSAKSVVPPHVVSNPESFCISTRVTFQFF